MKLRFGQPFPIRTILGLIIGLMGVLGLVLALIAGNIHRNLAMENHQEAIAGLIRLKATDLLLTVENHARDLGVALQSETAFRAAFDAGDVVGMQREMSRQFHQYFVTAGVLDLQKLVVYGPTYTPMTDVVVESAQALRGHAVCPHLLDAAKQRTGPQRMRVMAEICLVDGKPYQMVLVAIGGLRPHGYLGVVVDPIFALSSIETALGMPVQLGYAGGEAAYTSSVWPKPEQMQDVMVAKYTVPTSGGLPALSIAVLSDYRQLHAQLRHARWVLMITAAVTTLVFIGIALLVIRNTTIRPLRNLTARLRHVGRDRANLSSAVTTEGAAEIQELARDFNQMTTELGELYETLESMAFSDALTGLPNRNRFHERLSVMVQAGDTNTGAFAVLLMDLDRFKAVNDTLGHHIGDELLREVGSRLSHALRAMTFHEHPDRREEDDYLIARIGGDEFAILLPHLASTDQANLAAQALINALEEPCQIGEYKLHVGSSVGIALYPRHGSDQNTLMRRADLAMYHAKSTRRGYSVYEAALEEGNLLHFSLENELSRAIEQDELFLEYQPQIDMRTRRVIGTEALIRWMHPERGLVEPADFTPYAERSGVIQQLTDWVLRRALEDCAEWRRQGYAFGVSVNLSPVGLHHPGILNVVAASLQYSQVASHCLTLELTEGAVMTDPQYAIRVLTSLAETGVNISIDDFGTGHCSLSYIKKLPANEIKIDRSFIMGMTLDQGDMVIVRSTIDLAHNMGMSVVAEGVEDEEVMRNLHVLGCDKAQGYHIARPLPMAAFLNWLASDREHAGVGADQATR